LDLLTTSRKKREVNAIVFSIGSMRVANYSPYVPAGGDVVGADVVADGKVLGSSEVELELGETRFPT
jgi:hypothetical protein